LKNMKRHSLVSSSEKIFNLPNIITMVRIGIIPVLFFLLTSPDLKWSLMIAFMFFAAALTDFLDGYIARKYEIITKMGQFLDPIADKLIVNTAMILMIPIGRIPAWAVAITIIRDITVDGMRSIASGEGLVIDASSLGKKKTLCQCMAVIALIIHYPFLGLDAHAVGMLILYVALFLTVYSGLDYFIKFYRCTLSK
jgi:CDP-diacylglycerol---glycerol-3-phosphate 3-phosphatidyltransferase